MENNKKGKAGRPPILQPDEKTLATLKGLAAIHCTVEEAAGVLGVHRSTLHELFVRHPEVKEMWEQGQMAGKASLRRKQASLASKNATMAIFLGKQYLGQKDQQNHEVSGPRGEPINVTHEVGTIRKMIEAIAERDRAANS